MEFCKLRNKSDVRNTSVLQWAASFCWLESASCRKYCNKTELPVGDYVIKQNYLKVQNRTSCTGCCNETELSQSAFYTQQAFSLVTWGQHWRKLLFSPPPPPPPPLEPTYGEKNKIHIPRAQTSTQCYFIFGFSWSTFCCCLHLYLLSSLCA